MSKELHIWVKRPAKAAARDTKPVAPKPVPAAKPVETCKCGGKHV